MNVSVDTATILEVVIALSFMYFLLSLICSAINEAIASALKWRAKDLKLAIIALLGEARANDLYLDARVQILGKVKVVRWWQKAWKELKRAWNPQGNRNGYAVDGTSKLVLPATWSQEAVPPSGPFLHSAENLRPGGA